MRSIGVRNAVKRYGGLAVLDHLSLDIRAHEFIVLLGPSGCGKSTLLNAIAGLDPLDDGRIEIDGKIVTSMEPKDRGVAMVFQSYALYPTMTVEGNLSFGLRMAGVATKEINERVQSVAAMLQITSLLHQKPAQLSGGQRQRVAMGRALIRRTGIYLFDEPLSNLDAQLRAEMRVEIKRLHEQLQATMVYVTHDQIEAMTLATRIAVMRHGRIEQIAEPQVLYDRPATAFVAGFVGSPMMNLLPGVVRFEGDRVFAELSGGMVPLEHYPFLAPVTEGQKVILGVRPEDLAVIATEDVPHLRVLLPVLIREPMGAVSLVWFQFGQDRLASAMSPQAAKAGDGLMSVYINLTKLSLFCANDGARL